MKIRPVFCALNVPLTFTEPFMAGRCNVSESFAEQTITLNTNEQTKNNLLIFITILREQKYGVSKFPSTEERNYKISNSPLIPLRAAPLIKIIPKKATKQTEPRNGLSKF
jgi:hypothetical protein